MMSPAGQASAPVLHPDAAAAAGRGAPGGAPQRSRACLADVRAAGPRGGKPGPHPGPDRGLGPFGPRRGPGHQRQPGTPPPAELLAGPLMAAAEGARTRTGALFVVITDETGLRLAHPDADRLGERVSTDPSEALAGTRGHHPEHRHAGPVGRAPRFAPVVRAPGSSGSRTVVGEVSVGYSTETIGQSLARDIVPIAADRRRRAAGRGPGLVPAAAAAAAAHAGPGTGGNQHAGARPGGGPAGRGRRRRSAFQPTAGSASSTPRAQRLLGQPDLSGTALGGRPGPGPAQGPDPA